MKKLITFIFVISLFASCVTKKVTVVEKGRGKHKTTTTTTKKSRGLF